MKIFKSISEALCWIYNNRKQLDICKVETDLRKSSICKINNEIFIIDEYDILES